jgi:hypothetical protein
MGTTTGNLADELKTLRKGRGIHAADITDRVGPALTALCGLRPEDNAHTVRGKIGATLTALAKELPADLRTAVIAGFALVPQARHQFYQARVKWAAAQLHRDERTVRRRMDEAIDQLAGLAMATRAPVAPTRSASQWRTGALRVTLVLDLVTPEAFEVRRIVAEADGLTELALALTVTGSGENGLSIDVLHGGRLVRRRMESSDRFGFSLALPRPLSRGEQHEFALRFRIAPGTPMRPHYVCVPKAPCDSFDLHVRFDPDRRPLGVWELTDAFQRDVEDPKSACRPVELDAVDEVHLQFHQLTAGRAYGVRWENAPVSLAASG